MTSGSWFGQTESGDLSRGVFRVTRPWSWASVGSNRDTNLRLTKSSGKGTEPREKGQHEKPPEGQQDGEVLRPRRELRRGGSSGDARAAQRLQ